MWFSPIILPIMGINALCFVMLRQIKWTSLSFEVKYVKVHISFKIVNKFNRNILLTMSKGAEISILALI